MAIRWKKYEMYGPKKPGWIKKCFWYCKEKCTTMTGLYLISVILLMIFTDVFVQWGFDADYSLILPLYLFGILNIVLWFYMIKRIDQETSRPFFMEWLKHWDCDLLILLYGVLIFCFFGIMAVSYYRFQIPIYDWYGDYAGTYFSESSFMVVFVPIALVNNAFIMVIIRHLKNPGATKGNIL